MDDTYVTNLLLQYLHEKGLHNTFETLQEECGQNFDSSALKSGGLLMNALNEWYELNLVHTAVPEKVEDEEEDTILFQPANDSYIRREAALIKDVHINNIIDVRFSTAQERPVLAVGAADKTISLVSLSDFPSNNSTDETDSSSDLLTTSRRPGSFMFSASVLCLDWNPCKERQHLLLASFMDGLVAVLDTKEDVVLQTFREHRKFAVTCRWNDDGTKFASGSHDETVRIYGLKDETSNSYSLLQELNFKTAVEALTFVKNTNTLIVAVRRDNFLYYVNLDSYEREKVNMNSNLDNHVSFTAMYLSATDDARFLVVSTDKSRIIMFRLGTSEQVRNFYGATNDDYSQPRHVLDPSGRYLYGTSQDNSVYCWEVSSQRVVQRMVGHTARVRSLDLYGGVSSLVLATGSFDRTVKLWVQ
eukprot:GILK01002866.1.p1 GENE.GILK01002866.1~~GILK01002866.1.p1  ORF type:complete len:417 (+),score=72.76 GILK01002866.1:44-1294(+)